MREHGNATERQFAAHTASRRECAVLRDISSLLEFKGLWHIATAPYKGCHYATYPPKLIEPCIKSSSKEGDIVFDPFVGSGTTLLVARNLGRHGIGLDLSYNYLHDNARERLGYSRMLF